MNVNGEPPVMEVNGLTRWYRGESRPAVRNVSFVLESARTLAIVGESGAGKSTLGRLLAGLEAPDEGTVVVEGRPQRLRPGRPSRVQMVFQDPLDALNPLVSIETSLAEALREPGRRATRRRVAELLESVGLDPRRMRERPDAFSGGQLQRVGIARSLATKPTVLVCDEPTSALDVSVQAHVVNLLLDLQEAERFACALITHDLGVARVLADDVIVLRHGEVVEHASADAFFLRPQHAYSRQLLSADGGLSEPDRQSPPVARAMS